MKIFMIRHSESEDDILNCYGGCADFKLTEKGMMIASKYSNISLNLDIEKIFVSPYKRAKMVGEIFRDKLDCDMEIVNDLKEMNTYGVMSGVNKEIAKDIFRLILNSEEYKEFGYYAGKPFEGWEEVISFDNRVKRAFDYIVNHDNEVIAVVTHGGVFRRVIKIY